jgi:hypothetical protein
MKEMERKKIWKEAGVLLLAIITVLSTMAVTANDESPEFMLAGAEDILSSQQTNAFNPDWIHFDNGINNAGIGSSGGNVWEGAIRITPDELGGYDGWKLTKVRWFHFVQGNPQHSGNIKIYGNGTSTWPGALITTEPYTVTGHGWKEINLSNPVSLNDTEDVWVSIEIIQGGGGEYPLGIDFTFAIDGKGDWIYSNGEWLELQNLSSGGPGTLDYNWNIWAEVEESPPPSNSPPEIPEQPEGSAKGFVGVEYAFITSTTDPEGDQVSYLWDWGDDTPLEWTDYYDSGETMVADHAWTEVGVYDIQVKAKDSLGKESNWSDSQTIHIIEKPFLEIGNITGGLFKVYVGIGNPSDIAITNVNWSITFVGGLILSGATSGRLVSISAGKGKTISSGLILGFGKTMITVTAECAESSDTAEREAFVLLFFISYD